MIRAAHLDPELIADAILAAENWASAAIHAGMTAEEMRELETAIPHWDAVEKEWLVTARGIAGPNRKRKHRLGSATGPLFRPRHGSQTPGEQPPLPLLRADEALLHEEPQIPRESPETRRQCRRAGGEGKPSDET
jgi:hypothetical protein